MTTAARALRHPTGAGRVRAGNTPQLPSCDTDPFLPPTKNSPWIGNLCGHGGVVRHRQPNGSEWVCLSGLSAYRLWLLTRWPTEIDNAAGGQGAALICPPLTLSADADAA